MRLSLRLIFALFGLWLLWSGSYSLPGTEHFHPLILCLGIMSCLFVVLLSVRMKIVDLESLPVHITIRLLLYIPWLALEIIKANLDMTRIILSKKIDISPTLFNVTASQETDLAQVIYANSITLTPGTVAIDIVHGEIIVHSITRDARDGLLKSDMASRAAVLEKGRKHE